tara:strand:- start:597 stop:839 length:243 start_codon:yes stop_codon:yes gene_type:complete
MTTTTPLPPSSFRKSPKYERVEDLIEDVWDRAMKIEENYYKTGNPKLVQAFAMNIVIIQFWEEVHMRIMEEQSRANDKKR